MRPFPTIAMGLFIVAVTARFGEYDALPDAVGWVLVLVGTRRRGTTVRTLAVLALVVAAVVWFQAPRDYLDDHDQALRWAVNLPQLGFLVVLCRELSDVARAAGDRKAGDWLRHTMGATVLAGVLPVVVFGAGVDVLETPTYVLASLALVLAIAQLVHYAGRPWADGHTADSSPHRVTDA
jgi:hypothetical protein